LRDAGNSTFAGPAGYVFPAPLAMPAYEPPRHLLAAAVSRVLVGAADIGAFEYGGTGVVTPPASAVTLPSIADSFVRDGAYANTAYGGATALDVKTDTTAGLSRDALLRFDLGSLPSVSNARLRVYASLSAVDSVTATLYPVTGVWSESTLTWNTRPGYVTTAPLGSLLATCGTAAWKELDVTAHVKAELAAGRRVFALALHATAPSVEKMVIASREAANGPQLVVTP
jgi:hypothetical protein